MEFIGFGVTRQCVQPIPEKVDAMLKMDELTAKIK